MKVLHLAPGGKGCGIATYTTNLIIHFAPEDSHELYEIPPKTELSRLTSEEVLSFFEEFVAYARLFDVIHIQNEYGLFVGPGETSFGLRVFKKILLGLKEFNKKVFVTFHSEPVFLKALGLLNFENKKCARIWKKIGRLFTKENNLTAICHTEVSKNKFVRSGFKNSVVITHGVMERKFDKRKSLTGKTDAVVLSLFGYIGDYKGHEFALAIMELLPPNFKLCIIGGRHPYSDGEEIGKLLKLSNELGLANRVSITGWVIENKKETPFLIATYR